jgi:chaperone required for assembly of F1-ATPase
MTTNTSVYYVCSLTLQKEIFDHDGSKSLQAYKPGSKVELTEEQAVKYKHLIETEEQFNSRIPKTTAKK